MGTRLSTLLVKNAWHCPMLARLVGSSDTDAPWRATATNVFTPTFRDPPTTTSCLKTFIGFPHRSVPAFELFQGAHEALASSRVRHSSAFRVTDMHCVACRKHKKALG